MASLIDVNVLVAMMLESHAHHSTAKRWFEAQQRDSVVVCRIVQLGALRILNNPAIVREEALLASGCVTMWRELCDDFRIKRMYIEPSELDAHLLAFVNKRVHSPAIWTDAYLAAFAVAAGLEFVTLDKGYRSYPNLRLGILA